MKRGIGFDGITERRRDMLAAGITDSFIVTSYAITNAANLAKRLLLPD